MAARGLPEALHGYAIPLVQSLNAFSGETAMSVAVTRAVSPLRTRVSRPRAWIMTSPDAQKKLAPRGVVSTARVLVATIAVAPAARISVCAPGAPWTKMRPASSVTPDGLGDSLVP